MSDVWYEAVRNSETLPVFLFFEPIALFDLAVLKKKVKEKEEKKKKKLKVIKSEAEDLSESLGNPEGMPPMSQHPSPIPMISVKEE